MKRMLTTIGIILFIQIKTVAQQIVFNGFVYELKEDNTAIIVEGDKSLFLPDSVLKIPKTIVYNDSKYKVTEIGMLAFINKSEIKQLIIPKSVKTIHPGAFLNCINLEEIVLPSRPVWIDLVAFDNTKWYNNQPEGMAYIGNVAYKYKGDCPEKIELKYGTKAISPGAFYHSEVELEEYKIYIPERESDNLKELILPKGIEYVAGLQFSSITAIKLPKSVRELGYETFFCCNSLKEIHLPKQLRIIGEDCFSGFENLTSVLLPEKLEAIKEHAFRNCFSLKEITIPDRVKVIPKGLLECLAYVRTTPSAKTPLLTKITIGENVEVIDKWAFQGNDLEEIYCNATKPPLIIHNESNISSDWIAPATYRRDCTEEIILYVPKGCIDAYKKADGWNIINNIKEM